MRLPVLTSAIALLAALPAFAQTPAAAPAKGAAPAAAAPAAPAPADADPVLATVNGHAIHMSDVQGAASSLPPQLQQLPPQQLLPMLVEQLIDRQAILVAAKGEKLENEPAVATQMRDAANEKLEDAYLQQKISPQISDDALKAAYQAQYAGKPGPQQVEARHILVKTEAEAKSIIAQLEKGAKFDALAKKYSTDPGSTANGGELGWFSKDEMVPVFADAAFALKPGQYTKTPVHSQFGWHVILCEGKRTAPTPSFDDVKDKLRQDLEEKALKATLADARNKVDVQMFGANGLPEAAPGAASAPAPAAPAAPAPGTPAPATPAPAAPAGK